MNQFSTIYNITGEPIAIVLDELIDEFIIKTPQAITADKYSPQSTRQWFEIFQKKILIGYFSKLEYASSFLEGEFKSDRIRE